MLDDVNDAKDVITVVLTQGYYYPTFMQFAQVCVNICYF